MLRAQGLTQQQQADFILGALEGEAKREMMLIDPTQKNTSVKVLDHLETLYAKPATKAQLRLNFFNCKQRADETVNVFILRLREAFVRWQEGDRDGTEDENDLLLDQLMVGLQRGPLKQELTRQMRRNNTLTFTAACKEARALEKELQEEDEAYTNRVTTYAPIKQPLHHSEQIKSQIHAELKEELLGEMKREIKDQLKSLSGAIVEDIRTQLFSRERLPSNNYSPQARRQRSGTPFRWDEQGRPICHDCGVSGHVQRFCPQRQTRAQDF